MVSDEGPHSKAYSEVNFDYNKLEEKEELDDDSESSEDFHLPKVIEITEGIAIPKKVSIASLILTTAIHVANKGDQLEVLIKTKQQDNKNFDFLNHSDKYYPFYREIVKLCTKGSIEVDNFIGSLKKSKPETSTDLLDPLKDLCTEDSVFSSLAGRLMTKYSELNKQSSPAEKEAEEVESTANHDQDNEKNMYSENSQLKKALVWKVAESVAKHGKEVEGALLAFNDKYYCFLVAEDADNAYYAKVLKYQKKKLEELQ